MNMLDKLMKILPPPIKPEKGGKIDWQLYQEDYEINFPNDYKELISVYGVGVIDNFIKLLNPLSSTNYNFEMSKYLLSSYEVMKEDFPEFYSRPQLPKKGSFFPWAITENGESLILIIDGDSSEWNVAIHGVDQGEEELYEMGVTEFLFNLVNKKINSNLLPEDFPSSQISFEKLSDYLAS